MADCQIRNVRILREFEPVSADVLVRDGQIMDVRLINDMNDNEACSYEGEEAETVLDGEGRLLIPGMIDVHIHGADGYDMMDGTQDSLQAVSLACARTGCTSFLATSVSSSIEDLMGMLASVSRFQGKEQGARIAGVHIEGPYLNAKRKGMQNERHLRHPNVDEMKTILDHAGSLIRMVTLAPELPGGMEMVSFLNERDIVVAVAHSDATYEEAIQAFRCGASHVTHCFNGMRPIHHREPGVVVAAFEESHVSVQAIVDGVHLHPAIVRMMYREKGADRMVLITDALQAMGMGDGSYQFGGHQVTVSQGVATLADGTLASSTVTMNAALAKTVQAGIPLQDAVRMATETPATVLGLPRKGRIAPGMDADLVLLDDRFEVMWTMVNGAIVYRSAQDTSD